MPPGIDGKRSSSAQPCFRLKQTCLIIGAGELDLDKFGSSTVGQDLPGYRCRSSDREKVRIVFDNLATLKVFSKPWWGLQIRDRRLNSIAANKKGVKLVGALDKRQKRTSWWLGRNTPRDLSDSGEVSCRNSQVPIRETL